MALVIGWGNTLRSDDGVGVYAAQAIAQFGIETLAVHQLTLELAEPISHAGTIIFIDACDDAAPGVISVRRAEAQAGSSAFVHSVTPESLLAAARDLYGAQPDACLFTVGGADFGYGESLSPEVQAALSELITQVVGFCRGEACLVLTSDTGDTDG